MSGFSYFAQGWRLISRPGIRRFVILPLLVNILLMGGAFWWLFNRIGDWVPQLMSYIPSWLQWLSYLLWPLMVISLLLVFSYLFGIIMGFGFYGFVLGFGLAALGVAIPGTIYFFSGRWKKTRLIDA